MRRKCYRLLSLLSCIYEIFRKVSKLFTLKPDCKESTVQENASGRSEKASGNLVNAVIPVGTTNITKTKGRIITTQNKVNTKIGSAILMSNNVSCTSENNSQSDTQDTSNQDSLSMDIFF